MKHILILLFAIILCLDLQSQSIKALREGNGCDSLLVNFSIEPSNVTDTITSITWNFGDGTSVSGENAPVHLYKKPGTYKVSNLINSSVTLNLSSDIFVYTVPDSRFGYNDSLEIGSYSYVFGNIAQEVDSFVYTYSWIFDGVSGGNTRALIHNFPDAGIYRVGLIVENNYGCADTTVRPINVTNILQVPNVFTPNMDGYNDFFKVRTNGVNNYEFIVYSKTGVQVYKSETAVIMWDGRSMSGLELQPGLYYYVIRQLDGTSPEERNGFLQLIR